MCSTSACERSHPSNEMCSIFWHASLRHRVRGVRIKSCAGSGGAGKVPFCHSFLPICPTLSHLLPAAGATSALPQTAIGNGWGNEISHSIKYFDECQRTVHPERKRGFPAATKPRGLRRDPHRSTGPLTWRGCPVLVAAGACLPGAATSSLLHIGHTRPL